MKLNINRNDGSCSQLFLFLLIVWLVCFDVSGLFFLSLSLDFFCFKWEINFRNHYTLHEHIIVTMCVCTDMIYWCLSVTLQGCIERLGGDMKNLQHTVIVPWRHMTVFWSGTQENGKPLKFQTNIWTSRSIYQSSIRAI